MSDFDTDEGLEGLPDDLGAPSEPMGQLSLYFNNIRTENNGL